MSLKILSGLPSTEALRAASAIATGNVRWKDSHGWNVPMLAACTGDRDALRSLAENGCVITLHDLSLAIDLARLYGHDSIVDALHAIAKTN